MTAVRERVPTWAIAAGSLTLAFLVAILGVAFAFGELRGEVKALRERMDREVEVRNKQDEVMTARLDAMRDFLLRAPKQHFFGDLEGRD